MDKILKAYKEIQIGTREKSIKIMGMAIVVVVLLISFSVVTLRMFTMAQLNTQILDYDGHVRNAKFIEPDSANVIKCQAFMEDFCDHFFAFTPIPEYLEENLRYALELGDNSVKNAYAAFKNNNWYNDIIQNNLLQTIKIEENNALVVENTYKVFLKGTLTLREFGDASQMIKYRVIVTCDAVPIKPDYPNFKQGLFITNFNYDLKEI